MKKGERLRLQVVERAAEVLAFVGLPSITGDLVGDLIGLGVAVGAADMATTEPANVASLRGRFAADGKLVTASRDCRVVQRSHSVHCVYLDESFQMSICL